MFLEPPSSTLLDSILPPGEQTSKGAMRDPHFLPIRSQLPDRAASLRQAFSHENPRLIEMFTRRSRGGREQARNNFKLNRNTDDSLCQSIVYFAPDAIALL